MKLFLISFFIINTVIIERSATREDPNIGIFSGSEVQIDSIAPDKFKLTIDKPIKELFIEDGWVKEITKDSIIFINAEEKNYIFDQR